MLDREWDKELFPIILRQTIRNRGVTQRGLARVVGISPNSIYSYLIGRNFPALDVFANIAIALNYSADYLLGLITEPRTLNGQLDDEFKQEMLIMREAYTSMTEQQRKAFLEFLKTLRAS